MSAAPTDLAAALAAHRDGTLADEAAAAFAAALRADPELAAAARAHLRLEGALIVVCTEDDAMVHLRGLRARVAALMGNTPRLDALRQRIATRSATRPFTRRRRQPVRGSRPLVVFLAAVGFIAALLIGVVVYRSQGAVPGPERHLVEHAASVPVPPPTAPIRLDGLSVDGRIPAPGEVIVAGECPVSLETTSWAMELAAGGRLLLPATAEGTCILAAGRCLLRTVAGGVQLRVGGWQLRITAAAHLSLTRGEDGDLLVLATGGAEVIDAAGNTTVLAGDASALLPILGSALPLGGAGEVLVLRADDPATQEQLTTGEHLADGIRSMIDPRPDNDATAIDLSAIPGTLFTVRGDEVLEGEYRLEGRPQWFGVYLKTTDLTGMHHSLAEVASTDGWRTWRVPLSSINPIAHPPDGTGTGRLRPGMAVDFMRIQAGPEADCRLVLRSLRVTRPSLPALARDQGR